jgi:diguanylate cyclase (GGDEF)-like protein/PAS domain S-box-containing protein
VEVIRKDGQQRTLVLNSTVISSKEGAQQAILHLVDITERVHAEDALKNSEERYKTILDNIQDGYFEVDLLGNFTFFNHSLSQSLGFSKGELIGKNYRKYMDKRNARKVFQTFNHVFSTGEPVEGFSWEVITKNDSRRFAEASISLKKNSAGIPIGFRGITRDITERRHAEEALRQSEEKFRTIVNASPMGLFLYMLEPDGRLVFQDANPAADEILGVDCKQFVGLTIEEAFPPLAETEIPAMYRRAAAEGIPWSTEQVNYEDKLIQGAYEVHAFQSSPGNVVVMFNDITIRKRAEEELRENQEWLNLLFEFAPDAYYVNDLKGNFVDGNKAAEELIGYPKEELIGKSFLKLNLLPLSQIPRAAALLARNLLGQSTGPDEFTIRRKDQSLAPVEIRTYPIKTKGETLVLGIARDIIERKQAEDAIRESEEQFRSFFEYASIGTVMANLEGRFTKVNRAVCEMLGYSEQELLKKTFHDITHPDDLKEYLEHVQRLLSGETDFFRMEKRYIHKDGHSVWVALNAAAVRGAEGNVSRFIGQIQDITERKNTEAQLLHLATHDPLTNLLNRALFYDRLNHAIANAKRNAQQLAVLFVDLDDFKSVNDTHGHQIGDWILAAVAGRLKLCARESDTVARMGGDEFTYVLENIIRPADAELIAKKILTTLARPLRVDGIEFTISASIGISIYPDDGIDIESLIQHADSAMYRAKELELNVQFAHRE